MYLIDTDILIYSLKGVAPVTKRFEESGESPKAVSVVSYGELRYGAAKSQRREKNMATVARVAEIFPLVPVDRGVMDIYGDLKGALAPKGIVVDDLDLMIGATALYLNYVLVTNNEKHFAKIPGLSFENWTK